MPSFAICGGVGGRRAACAGRWRWMVEGGVMWWGAVVLWWGGWAGRLTSVTKVVDTTR